VHRKSITGEIMKTSLLKILATSMAVCALQASAAVVIIDTFATNDAGCSQPSSPTFTTCGSTVPVHTGAPGSRDLTLTRTDSDTTQSISVAVTGGRFHTSNAIDAQSTTTLDYKALGGLDLTSSGTQAGLYLTYHIDLDNTFGGGGMAMSIGITSGMNTNNFTLPGVLTAVQLSASNPEGLFYLYIPFSTFNAGSACTTCSSADRIFLTFAGQRDALDMTLNYFSTYDAPPSSTPIPGTLLLIGLGLLGFLRSKKQA
jgi:hypothetical protein